MWRSSASGVCFKTSGPMHHMHVLSEYYWYQGEFWTCQSGSQATAATQHNWEQHVPPSVMGYDHLQTCVEQHAAVLSHEQVPHVFQFVHRFSNPSYMLSPLSPSPQRKPQPQSCPSLHLPCLYTRSVEMYLTVYTTVHTQAGAVRTKLWLRT